MATAYANPVHLDMTSYHTNTYNNNYDFASPPREVSVPSTQAYATTNQNEQALVPYQTPSFDTSIEDRSVAGQADALAIFEQQNKPAAAPAPSSSYSASQAAAFAQYENKKSSSAASASYSPSHSQSQAEALARFEKNKSTSAAISTSYSASQAAALAQYSKSYTESPDSSALVRAQPRSVVQSASSEWKKYETNHEKKSRRKVRRQTRTAGAAVGGAVVGGLIGGPIGAIVVGGGAAATTRHLVKRGEKRKDDRMAQHQLAKNAPTVGHEFL